MKTFTTTPKTKIGTFLLFILMLIATGAMINVAIGLNSSITDIRETFSNAFGNDTTTSPLGVISLALCSLPILFFGALTVWALAYFVSILKARLIFDDHSMTFEFNPRLPSYRNRGVKPFSVQYEQIQKIKGFGETGALEIFDVQGKKYRLFPVMFGKNYGENVLEELKRRLPADLHSSIRDHTVVQKDWSRKQRIASIPLFICFVAYFVTHFFDPNISSRPWINAWHVEFRPPWLESVWRYSPDGDERFWVIGHHIQYYRIYRYPEEQKRSWKLPRSILASNYPDAVSMDSKGNPIVWAGEEIFHYQNGNWQVISPQNKWSYIDWGERGAAIGEQAWAVPQDKQFIKIDALTGAWKANPLPETAVKQGLSPISMRLSTQGNFLVLMENDSAHHVFLYKYKNEEWDSQQYPVLLPEETRIEDYFLDENGFLWVLAISRSGAIVEQINRSGDFIWTSIPAPVDIENWHYYERIFTDIHGRMWISSATYPPFITVFQPIWKGDATKIVTYTIGNSNYQEDVFNQPFMFSDGQLWGFDRRITTIDTNQKDLPAPLPDWFGNLDWNLIRLAILPFQLIATIYMTIQSKKLQKQLKLRS
ncbi:MAG: hypothetical protein HY867_01130 [Chloroflexi bacterium]|nr:hypothetical protein [Chloroflexota bacterium]